MRKVKKFTTISTFSFAFLLTSCLDGPQLFKQEGSADNAFVNLKLSQVEDGIYDTAVDANLLTNQSISLPDGTALNFPPNSLVMSSTITVQYGSSLLSAELAESSGAGSLSEASMPVVVSASTAQDTTSPFTMELPISQSSLRLNSEDEFEKLVVLFKKSKIENGEIAEGIIPRVDISVKDRKAKFSTRFFGSYQLAFTQNKISQSIERTTTVPILTQKTAKALPSVGWSVSYFKTISGQSSGVVNFSQTGLKDPLRCVTHVDRNQLVPFDIVKTVANSGSISFNLSEFNAFASSDVFKIRLDCTDSQGRNEKSNWFTFFDPVSDPRNNSVSSLKLLSYSQGSIAAPHTNFLPISLNFDSAPNFSSLSNGVSVQNQKSNSLVSFNAIPSNVGTSALLVPNFGTWPIFTPLNITLNASVVKGSSTGNLNANSNFSLHTSDGNWHPAPPMNFGANHAIRVYFDTNDQGKSVYIRASASAGVGINYFDGNSWGTEMWVGGTPGAAGAWIDPTGVAYAAFRDNTGSSFKAYRYNQSTASWENILNQSSSNSTTFFPFGLIASHKGSNSAYLIHSYTTNSNEIKICKLSSANVDCGTESIVAFQVNASFIIARVNRNGDLVLGASQGVNLKSKFLTSEGNWSSEFASASLGADQDFEVNLLDRRPGDAYPIALGVYGSSANPFYYTSSNLTWNSELNFLNGHTGSTSYPTQRPSISVASGGNAMLVIRESTNYNLHIRMIRGYGTEDVYHNMSTLMYDPSERTQSLVNQDGVGIVAFKRSTIDITHVLCKLNSPSISCVTSNESDVDFTNSNPNKFTLLQDPSGNFMSLFQQFNAPKNLKMKRFRYDEYSAVPSTVDLNFGISGLTSALGASMDNFGRVKATMINSGDMVFSNFK